MCLFPFFPFSHVIQGFLGVFKGSPPPTYLDNTQSNLLKYTLGGCKIKLAADRRCINKRKIDYRSVLVCVRKLFFNSLLSMLQWRTWSAMMDHRRGRISCHRTCSHSSRSLMKITNQWTKPQFVFMGVFFCVCVCVCLKLKEQKEELQCHFICT